jgi:serine/threonine-protein kinase
VLNDHPQGLPVDVALIIFRGLVRALDVAHSNNVLHRDIKPGNIMLDLDGRDVREVQVGDVKVGDFGLGMGDTDMLQSIAQSASLNRENTLVGTLAYIAPELRDGRQKADARGDLYSAGVVLFEMLTGERPAGAELPRGVREDVPEAMDEVFRRLYARYDRRYESAAAVLEDLDGRFAVASVPPIPQVSTGTARAPAPPRVRSRTCESCGGAIGDEDQFCIHCGRQLAAEIRRCPACDAYPGPNDSYCIFCGATLKAASSS